jgi:hypothetical protein
VPVPIAPVSITAVRVATSIRQARRFVMRIMVVFLTRDVGFLFRSLK